MSDDDERTLQSIYKVTGTQMDENFLSFLVGIGTVKNNFLSQLTEEVLQRLITAGISQWQMKFHTDFWFPKYPNDKNSEPTVLCVDDLNFGFIIWLIACGISGLMFLCEILILILTQSNFYLQDLIGLMSFGIFFKKIKIVQKLKLPN